MASASPKVASAVRASRTDRDPDAVRCRRCAKVSARPRSMIAFSQVPFSETRPGCACTEARSRMVLAFPKSSRSSRASDRSRPAESDNQRMDDVAIA